MTRRDRQSEWKQISLRIFRLCNLHFVKTRTSVVSSWTTSHDQGPPATFIEFITSMAQRATVNTALKGIVTLRSEGYMADWQFSRRIQKQPLPERHPSRTRSSRHCPCTAQEEHGELLRCLFSSRQGGCLVCFVKEDWLQEVPAGGIHPDKKQLSLAVFPG